MTYRLILFRLRDKMIIKKIKYMLFILILIKIELNAKIYAGINQNKFNGAIGPLKKSDGFQKDYPKKDTTFTGISYVFGYRKNNTYSIYIETGKLTSNYLYNSNSYKTDISFTILGYEYFFNYTNKIKPLVGINLGLGYAYIHNLDGGIEYIFGIPGIVIGLQYTLTKKIKPIIKIQWANNSESTYTRIRYGLNYIF